MLTPLPKPRVRSPLRMALGKAWFITKRRLNWYVSLKAYTNNRSAFDMAFTHATHHTPLLRQLKGVDMWLQHNKAASLKDRKSVV